MISKFPTQTETSPQSMNLLTLTSLVLITDLTTMESREKVTIHLSKNKDSSVNNWRFKFEIQVSKINTNVSQEIVLLNRMQKLLLLNYERYLWSSHIAAFWGLFGYVAPAFAVSKQPFLHWPCRAQEDTLGTQGTSWPVHACFVVINPKRFKTNRILSQRLSGLIFTTWLLSQASGLLELHHPNGPC